MPRPLRAPKPQMPEQTAKARAREAKLEAVVIRADGTREDLGVVSYWHKNPLKRLAWRLKGKAA